MTASPRHGHWPISSGAAGTNAHAQAVGWCCGARAVDRKRDGCPRVVNLGSAKTDLFYERKKFGFRKTG